MVEGAGMEFNAKLLAAIHRLFTSGELTDIGTMK